MVGDVYVYVRIVGLLGFRCAVLVAGWVVVPVIGRCPYLVVRAPLRIDSRTAHKDRLDDIVRAVDVRIADNLGIVTVLNHDGGDILTGIQRVHVLYDYQVCAVVYLLYHPQVVHISVAVQVQVAYLAGIVVEEPFELFQCARLCKGDGYCLKVEVVTQVGGGIDIDGFRRCRHCFGCDDRGGGLLDNYSSGLFDHYGGGLFGDHRSGYNARCQAERCGYDTKDIPFHVR